MNQPQEEAVTMHEVGRAVQGAPPRELEHLAGVVARVLRDAFAAAADARSAGDADARAFVDMVREQVEAALRLGEEGSLSHLAEAEQLGQEVRDQVEQATVEFAALVSSVRTSADETASVVRTELERLRHDAERELERVRSEVTLAAREAQALRDQAEGVERGNAELVAVATDEMAALRQTIADERARLEASVQEASTRVAELVDAARSEMEELRSAVARSLEEPLQEAEESISGSTDDARALLDDRARELAAEIDAARDTVGRLRIEAITRLEAAGGEVIAAGEQKVRELAALVAHMGEERSLVEETRDSVVAWLEATARDADRLRIEGDRLSTQLIDDASAVLEDARRQSEAIRQQALEDALAIISVARELITELGASATSERADAVEAAEVSLRLAAGQMAPPTPAPSGGDVRLRVSGGAEAAVTEGSAGDDDVVITIRGVEPSA